jgi:hypothetical protein
MMSVQDWERRADSLINVHLDKLDVDVCQKIDQLEEPSQLQNETHFVTDSARKDERIP